MPNDSRAALRAAMEQYRKSAPKSTSEEIKKQKPVNNAENKPFTAIENIKKSIFDPEAAHRSIYAKTYKEDLAKEAELNKSFKGKIKAAPGKEVEAFESNLHVQNTYNKPIQTNIQTLQSLVSEAEVLKSEIDKTKEADKISRFNSLVEQIKTIEKQTEDLSDQKYRLYQQFETKNNVDYTDYFTKQKAEIKRLKKESGLDNTLAYYLTLPSPSKILSRVAGKGLELKAAEAVIEETERLYKAPTKKEGTGVGNFAKSVKNIASENEFWENIITLGVSGLEDNAVILRTVNKAGSGQTLNKDEEILMDALLSKTLISAQREGNLSIGYQGGQMLTEAAPFIISFLATSGVASGITKGTAKITQKAIYNYTKRKLVKKLGKEATEAAIKNAEAQALLKLSTSTLAKITPKIASGVANVTAGAAARTPLMPTSYSQFTENITPTVMGKTEQGYKMQKGMTPAQAIKDVYIEVASEATGGAFQLGIVGKLLNKTHVDKLLNNAVGNRLNQVLFKSKGIIDRAGYNGLIQEIGEEHIGNAARYITDVIDKEEFKDFYSWENQAAMISSFAVMSVLGIIPNEINRKKIYNNYKNQIHNLNLKPEQINELNTVIDKANYKQRALALGEYALKNGLVQASDIKEQFSENGQKVLNDLLAYSVAYTEKKAINNVIQSENPQIPFGAEVKGNEVNVLNGQGEILYSNSYSTKEEAKEVSNRLNDQIESIHKEQEAKQDISDSIIYDNDEIRNDDGAIYEFNVTETNELPNGYIPKILNENPNSIHLRTSIEELNDPDLKVVVVKEKYVKQDEQGNPVITNVDNVISVDLAKKLLEKSQLYTPEAEKEIANDIAEKTISNTKIQELEAKNGGIYVNTDAGRMLIPLGSYQILNIEGDEIELTTQEQIEDEQPTTFITTLQEQGYIQNEEFNENAEQEVEKIVSDGVTTEKTEQSRELDLNNPEDELIYTEQKIGKEKTAKHAKKIIENLNKQIDSINKKIDKETKLSKIADLEGEIQAIEGQIQLYNDYISSAEQTQEVIPEPVQKTQPAVPETTEQQEEQEVEKIKSTPEVENEPHTTFETVEEKQVEPNKIEILKTINYRGSTINKIENIFYEPNQKIGEEFNEDFLYVSNGFISALEEGLKPIKVISILDKNKKGEWHHLFTKNEDGTFDTKYVKFNEPVTESATEQTKQTKTEEGQPEAREGEREQRTTTQPIVEEQTIEETQQKEGLKIGDKINYRGHEGFILKEYPQDEWDKKQNYKLYRVNINGDERDLTINDVNKEYPKGLNIKDGNPLIDKTGKIKQVWYNGTEFRNNKPQIVIDYIFNDRGKNYQDEMFIDMDKFYDRFSVAKSENAAKNAYNEINSIDKYNDRISLGGLTEEEKAEKQSKIDVIVDKYKLTNSEPINKESLQSNIDTQIEAQNINTEPTEAQKEESKPSKAPAIKALGKEIKKPTETSSSEKPNNSKSEQKKYATIKFYDGDTRTGEVISENEKEISIKAENGRTYTVPVSNIVERSSEKPEKEQQPELKPTEGKLSLFSTISLDQSLTDLSSEERVKIVQDAIEQINDGKKVVIVDDMFDHLETKFKDNKTTLERINNLRKINGDVIGFTIGDEITLNSNQVTINKCIVAFEHERQHVENKEDKVWNDIKNDIAENIDNETLQKEVSALSGNSFYEGLSNNVLADEYIAYVIQKTFEGKEIKSSLKYKNIIQDEYRKRNGKRLSILRGGTYPNIDAERRIGQNIVDNETGENRFLGSVSEGQERERIISEAKENGTYLKAPNGKPTNLNESQWVQVRTKAFKDWFGDWENDPENASKVVDENGEPLVVYHGSKSKFNVFELNKANRTGASEGYGFYFTDNKDIAKGYEGNNGNLFEVFLSIKKPLNKNAKPFKNTDIYKIINEAVNNEIIENEGDIKDYKDTFLSNIVDTYSTSFNNSMNEAVKMLSENDLAIDQVADLANIIGDENIAFKSTTDATGYDGIYVKDFQAGEGDVHIAWYPSQIKSATENIGTFDSENEDIRFATAPTSDIGFYSTVENALLKINQEKGTPEQFKAMLLKNGAKQAELDWMDYDGTFTGKSITKAEIQQWIDENKIQVEEVEKGTFNPRAVNKNDVKSVRFNQFGSGYYIVSWNDPEIGDIEISTSEAIDEEEAIEEAIERANYDDIEYRLAKTKFSQYVLPNGENYKELLLTMPSKYRYFSKEMYDKYGEDWINNMTEDELKRKKQLENKDESYFQSSHFDESNILAHVRFNERTDKNGDKVLFIEELQSDWAQEGKKEGFNGKPHYIKEGDVYKVYDGAGTYFVDAKTETEAKEIIKTNPILGTHGVPDMPFKKTDQWVNLAARRMMRYAAENGFDRIAWTNGEQQADRYDLSKQVDDIYTSEYGEEWTNRGYEKRKDVEITLNGGEVIKLVVDDSGKIVSGDYVGERLENVIGKEITEKILSANIDTNFGQQDLKVGGEGMKGFYDGIVPSAMSKLGKPFGAKVETIEIEEIGQQQSIPITEEMKESVMQGIPLFAINISSIPENRLVEVYIDAYNSKDYPTFKAKLQDVQKVKAKMREEGMKPFTNKDLEVIRNLVRNGYSIEDAINHTANSTDITNAAIGSKQRQRVVEKYKELKSSAKHKTFKESVKDAVDFAKNISEDKTWGEWKLMDEKKRLAMKQILTQLKNAATKKDINRELDKMFDIIIERQNSVAKNVLDKALNLKISDTSGKGVRVGKKVDDNTRVAIETLKENLNKGVLEITSKIEGLSEKLETEQDELLKTDLSAKILGLRYALLYDEVINGITEEISESKEELNTINKENKKELKTYIRENMISLQNNLEFFINEVTGLIQEGIAARKAFLAKEELHNSEILNDADLDLKHVKEKVFTSRDKNFVRTALLAITSPLRTFSTMLKEIGKYFPEGKGYLYKRFVEEGIIKAAQTEYLGIKEVENTLAENINRIFGKKYSLAKLANYSNKSKGVEVKFKRGKISEVKEINNGHVMYIYMVNKMADGKMKLREMGITEADVEKMKNTLSDKAIEFCDYVQDELLPALRKKYNKTHVKLFGIQMDEIENYFPLKIAQEAVKKENDLDDQTNYLVPSMVTGSIIRRKKNKKTLNIMEANAIDVLQAYFKEMERWNAYAFMIKDLNFLNSSLSFKNKLNSLSDGMAKRFFELSQIAVKKYSGKRSEVDEFITKASKFIAASKIAFRLNTAIKQILGLVAYSHEISDPNFLKYGLKNMIDITKSNIKWCKKNLPMFEERWKSRTGGDDRLSLSDENLNKLGNMFNKISSKGMIANAFVDLIASSWGAKTMYDTKYAYYKKRYPEEIAKEKALVAAENIYNETQQSGESLYLSKVQSDRTFMNASFSLFNNASFSFGRQLIEALRGIQAYTKDGKTIIDNKKKMYIREGLTEENAEKFAKEDTKRSLVRDVLRVGVFGYIVQAAWNIASDNSFAENISNIYIMLFGDDDEKEKLKEEKSLELKKGLLLGFIQPVRGLIGGKELESLLSLTIEGYDPDFVASSMRANPLGSDIMQFYKDIIDSANKGDWMLISNALLTLSTSFTGSNINSIYNSIYAIYDFIATSDVTIHDVSYDLGILANIPKSKQKSLALTPREGEKLEDYIERYVKLKRLHKYGALSIIANKKPTKYEETAVAKEINYQYDNLNITVREIKKTIEEKKEDDILFEFRPKTYLHALKVLGIYSKEYKKRLLTSRERSILQKAYEDLINDPEYKDKID